MMDAMVFSPEGGAMETALVALALDVAVKGMLVVAVASLVALSLRGSSAAARHFVWTVAAAALLALPALSLMVPRWRLSLPGVPETGWYAERFWVVPPGAVVAEVRAPGPVRPPRPPRPPRPAIAPTAPRGLGVIVLPAPLPARAEVRAGWGEPAAVIAVPAPAPPSGRERRAARGSGMDDAGVVAGAARGGRLLPRAVRRLRAPAAALGLLLATWAIGFLGVLSAIVVGVLRVRRTTRASSPVRDGWRVELLRRTCAELGVRRSVALLEGDGHAMPMTWGVLRPVVLVPSTSAGWPAARLEAVLRHELAHVRRYDALTQLVAEIACALHWFNPLAWLVSKRLRAEREMACDDRVLAAGSRASDYAEQLVLLARALRPVPTSIAAVTMARPGQLRGRIQALLDERRSRSGVPLWLALPGWAVAVALVVPLSAMTPVPRTDFAPVDEPAVHVIAPGELGGVHAIPSPAPPVMALPGDGVFRTPPLQDVPCWEADASARQTSMSRRNEDMTYLWSRRGCEVEIRTRGDVTFTPDFTDIATIASGGSVVLSEEARGTKRRLEIQPAGGRLEYSWSIDGRTRPFDDDARAWLRSVIVQFFRNSGYAANERSAYILREHGVAGLLQEIAHLRGDHARRRYYQAALESGDVPASQAATLLARAGREISSDYELAELLSSTATRYDFTDAVRDAYVGASRTLESDYERRRALAAVLARGRLDAASAAAVLESAAELRSDYEAATLLIGLAGSDLSDVAVQRAFLRATAAIESDYEHRRALSSLLSNERLAPEALRVALESARAIDSDYELAELLLQVARTQALTPELQEDFVRTLDTIQSSHEHGRVSSALLRASQSRR